MTDSDPTRAAAGYRTYFIVFAALMVLLWATYEVSRHDFGEANLLVAMSIATAKAILIALFFMNLRRSVSLTKLVAASGVLWLVIMFGLTLADYWTRTEAGGGP